MSTQQLEYALNPRSVVLIGATERENSVGAALTKALVDGGFQGELTLIHPRYDNLFGQPCFPHLARLSDIPDLAIVAVPAAQIPDELTKLGIRKVKAAILVSDIGGKRPKQLQQQILAVAEQFGIRLLGPASDGLIIPARGLHASVASVTALAGDIALVSASSGVTSAVLDWATVRGIGFSKIVSTGQEADIELADVLDFLNEDEDTESILIYIENLKNPRKFLSAARAVSRSKPVIVVRGGRHADLSEMTDRVYDAAIRRAGMLRVPSLEMLFDAVQVLGGVTPPAGNALSIISNSHDTCSLALDTLSSLGGKLADVRVEISADREQVLPKRRVRNPMILPAAAEPKAYVEALRKLRDKSSSDGILVLHTPNSVADSTAIAQALIEEEQKNHTCRLFTCWLGQSSVLESRYLFSHNGIPSLMTPEKAVYGFVQVAQHHRNQALLLESPPARAPSLSGDLVGARSIVQEALQKGRVNLGSATVLKILELAGVPVVPEELGASPQDAAEIAEKMDCPVALKIQSADLMDKASVGGVALNLFGFEAVLQTAAAMRKRLSERYPDARLDGFLVQPMRYLPNALEVVLDVVDDETFGPVITIGERHSDNVTVALPPLNMSLALEALQQSDVGKRIRRWGVTATRIENSVSQCLVQLSELVVNVPELHELQISPLAVDHEGIAAVDARGTVRAAPELHEAEERLAIRPYPQYLEQELLTTDGMRLQLRPVKPEDEAAFRSWFSTLPSQDIYTRFFHVFRQLSAQLAARLTQIDYHREMAFVAERGAHFVAEARLTLTSDGQRGEFAVLISPSLRGRGVGRQLLEVLLDYAGQRGIKTLFGEVLAENRAMLKLAEKLDFVARPKAGDAGVVIIEREVQLDPPEVANLAT